MGPIGCGAVEVFGKIHNAGACGYQSGVSGFVIDHHVLAIDDHAVVRELEGFEFYIAMDSGFLGSSGKWKEGEHCDEAFHKTIYEFGW
jgi:hypothetical protein